eukprot:gnl/Chilomastix_caulleri/3715.p2 GENE.gnl/Chilomastix_caulleri/3715~~gnl/Chilomastix_caulleri/3715.p2  ORF type:complete len:86 (-),score=9.24 gnl/Chilomastix_caulleri/3715:10-267(-)
MKGIKQSMLFHNCNHWDSEMEGQQKLMKKVGTTSTNPVNDNNYNLLINGGYVDSNEIIGNADEMLENGETPVGNPISNSNENFKI